MSRSFYKLLIPSIVDICVFKSNKLRLKKYSNFFPNKKKIPNILCWSSQPVLFPRFNRKRISVHTGRAFATFQIRSSMLYNKLVALIRTKKLGPSIHFSKKKKK